MQNFSSAVCAASSAGPASAAAAADGAVGPVVHPAAVRGENENFKIYFLMIIFKLARTRLPTCAPLPPPLMTNLMR